MFGKFFKVLRGRKGMIPFRSISQENLEEPPPKTRRLEDSPNRSAEAPDVSILDVNMEVDEDNQGSAGVTSFAEAHGNLIGNVEFGGILISTATGQQQGGLSTSIIGTQPWELYVRENCKLRKPVSYPVREDLRLMGEESINPKFPQTSIVSECMENTFPIRQKDFSTNEVSPRKTIDLYPGLQDYDELQKEFGRVVGKDVDAFEQKVGVMLERYCYGALALKNKLCSTHQECREARRILENKDEGADKFSASLVIFCCSESGGKWPDVLFKKEQEEKDSQEVKYSRMAVRGSLFEVSCTDVYLQDKKVLTPPRFYQAFLACYYLHLVLHIEVNCEVLETMFLPLLHVLMKCPDLKKEIYEMMEDLSL